MTQRMRMRSGFDAFRNMRRVALLLDPTLSKNITHQMPRIAAAWKALSEGERAHHRQVARSCGPVPVKGRKRVGKGVGVKKKKTKDPLKPKGTRSAYLFFTMHRLPMIQKEHSLSVTEGIKLVAQEWHALVDRLEYANQAKGDKERYHKELAIYQQGTIDTL